MKRTRLILSIAGGLALLMGLYMWIAPGDDDSIRESSTALADGSNQSSNGSPTIYRQTSAPEQPKGVFAHLPQSRKGMPLENDPFTAESVEEQEWLDRNGYPNAEQWVAYSSASDGLLAQAAAGGDSIAAVIVDSRALANGDKEALNRLLKAGQTGSSFALSMLQAYMAGSSKGSASLAYSVGRVLEMKGDSRAGLARDFSAAATKLTPEQKIKAEANALSLFSQMNETSKKQPFVDRRPFTPK